MTQHLLESFGLYGGTVVIAFIAGLFPLVSIEVFLVGLSALGAATVDQLLVCSLLASCGHQVAKTITYFTGEAALEHGRLKPKIDKIRHKIERWNKARHGVLFLGATVGLPPMYLIGFIAHPLMEIRFWPFTILSFVGRIGRYFVLAVVPLLFR